MLERKKRRRKQRKKEKGNQERLLSTDNIEGQTKTQSKIFVHENHHHHDYAIILYVPVLIILFFNTSCISSFIVIRTELYIYIANRLCKLQEKLC